MKKNISIAASFLLFVLIVFPVFSEGVKAYEVFILCYHHIVEGEPEGNSETNLADFKKQMGFLQENDFSVLSLAEFKEHHREGSFPEKSVLLTFDDGYLSFFSKAYPVLKEYDFPAVVFPIVSHMPGLERIILFSEKMSFNNIRYMINMSGLIDIGSHTYDLHHYTENQTPAILQQPEESRENYKCRIKQDLVISRNLLTLQIDQEIFALAWPYGVTTERARELAQETGFKLFFELGDVPFTPEDSLQAIPRFLVDTIEFTDFVNFF